MINVNTSIGKIGDMCLCKIVYVLVWMQLGCNEWTIHAYANITLTHSLTNLATLYTHLFFYFRKIWDDGDSYTVGYKQGEWNGKGEWEWADGSREIAYYVDGKAEGAAKYYDKDGHEEDKFYINGELVEQ